MERAHYASTSLIGNVNAFSMPMLQRTVVCCGMQLSAEMVMGMAYLADFDLIIKSLVCKQNTRQAILSLKLYRQESM